MDGAEPVLLFLFVVLKSCEKKNLSTYKSVCEKNNLSLPRSALLARPFGLNVHENIALIFLTIHPRDYSTL